MKIPSIIKIILLLIFLVLSQYNCRLNVDKDKPEIEPSKLEINKYRFEQLLVTDIFEENRIVFRYIESNCGACNLRSRDFLEELIESTNRKIPVIILTKFRKDTDEQIFEHNYNNSAKVIHSHDTIFTYNDIPIKSTCFALLNSKNEIISWFFPGVEDGSEFAKHVSR